MASRWRQRPEGSNWGDFGPDDEIGRLNLLTDARRRVALIAHNHNVGSMNRGFLFNDPARLLRATRLGMALDHIESFDDNRVLVRQHNDFVRI